MKRNWRKSLKYAVGGDFARSASAQLAYLAGLRDAAAIKADGRNCQAAGEYSRGYDWGHDSHQNAIRTEIRRVKKEMKDA